MLSENGRFNCFCNLCEPNLAVQEGPDATSFAARWARRDKFAPASSASRARRRHGELQSQGPQGQAHEPGPGRGLQRGGRPVRIEQAVLNRKKAC